MMPIFGINADAVQSPTAAERAPGAPRAEKNEEERRPQQPRTDEYVPEKPSEPTGRYWMERDEEGRPRICFDDPERTANAAKQPAGVSDAEKPDAAAPAAGEPDPAGRGARGPEEKKNKDEVWECSTDRVDREIEALKKKQQALEQRLSTETDEAEIKDLERRLARAEQELKQKDNDTYRRQNASFTRLS